MSGSKIGVLAGALLVAAAPLWADSTLDVQCVDASGGPVSGAKVMVQIVGAGKWKDKKSDGKGMASFTKLDDGVYRVLGRKEGLAPAFHEFTVLKGSAHESVKLEFKPGASEKLVYFEDQAQQQKAFDVLNNGIKLMQEAKFAEAEKLVREALELNPSNPDAYFNLAVALLQQQKWDAGEAALKKAASLAAQLSELPARSGGTNPYMDLKGRIDLVAKKIPGLKLRGDADKALAAKRFDEAAVLYRKAIDGESEQDPDLYYNLAVALGNSRKYDDAVAALDAAMKLKPQDAQFQDLKKRILDYKQNEVLIQAQSTMEAANKLFDAKDYAGALKSYQAMLQTVPEKNQAPIWFQMGRSQAELKQAAAATESFKKAMALAPANADYRKVLAQHYLNEKLYQEALDLYSEADAGGSQPVDQTLFALGGRLSSQGNAEVAQVAYERVLKANPKHAEACYELGMLLYYAKKADARAKELLTKYVELGTQKDHLDNAKTVLIVIQRRMTKK